MTSTVNGYAVAVPSIAQPGIGLRLVQRIFHAAVCARRRHQTQRALNQLPDHMLKDIGVRRCEIDSLAETLASGRWDLTRIPRDPINHRIQNF